MTILWDWRLKVLTYLVHNVQNDFILYRCTAHFHLINKLSSLAIIWKSFFVFLLLNGVLQKKIEYFHIRNLECRTHLHIFANMEKEKVISYLKSAVSNVFTNTCQFGAQNGRCLSFHNKIKTSQVLHCWVLSRFWF